MALTKEDGFRIREEHSTIKEKLICDKHNLKQLGGSKTKIDGFDDNKNVSIKNASGNSTQVHLTTQGNFIKVLNLDENCATFVKLFCGNSDIDNNGSDRYYPSQIEQNIVKSFSDFLNSEKLKVIDLILRNNFDITHIIYNDTKNNKEYQLTYDEIVEKVIDCKWVFKKGGIHLKNSKGKTFFHFQRESKSNKNNRYNVLWHIHKHLFV